MQATRRPLNVDAWNWRTMFGVIPVHSVYHKWTHLIRLKIIIKCTLFPLLVDGCRCFFFLLSIFFRCLPLHVIKSRWFFSSSTPPLLNPLKFFVALEWEEVAARSLSIPPPHRHRSTQIHPIQRSFPLPICIQFANSANSDACAEVMHNVTRLMIDPDLVIKSINYAKHCHHSESKIVYSHSPALPVFFLHTQKEPFTQRSVYSWKRCSFTFFTQRFLPLVVVAFLICTSQQAHFSNTSTRKFTLIAPVSISPVSVQIVVLISEKNAFFSGDENWK